MNVTLRQLRAFIAVAEAKHFTQAAEKLDVSQSTISTLVRELEENLGLRLFDRHTRMLRLTHAGAELLPLVRKVLADIDTVIGSSDELRTLARGRVSVAASSLQAAFLMPRIIREFCAEHPNIKVNLYDVSQTEVHEMVRAGEVDFGLGTRSETRDDLATSVLFADAYICLMLPDHPLARFDSITWRHLEQTTLIGPPPGNPVREHMDFALAAEGIALQREYEASLPLTIIGMVEGGLGVAVMTTAVTKLARAMGLTVRPITDPVVERDMSLLFHAERSLSPAAETFRNTLLRNRARLADYTREGVT